MYVRINDYVMFRKYNEYGLLTDNSMFGYRIAGDEERYPGEKYVSESGAIMLEILNKEPQHIDSIVDKLMAIFIGVERDELKKDVVDFFKQFIDEGFLISAQTYDECANPVKNENAGTLKNNANTIVESCNKNIIGENDFLRSLHIEVASECNERCVHCYIPHEYKNSTISTDLFYKIVEEGREMNIINVTLSGGEPLLHKDFVKLLAKCRKLDLSVNVLSNLTLLSDEVIEEMIKNPLLCVQTSIYSMDADIHDSITQVKGSLDKTKEALLKLKELEIPVQISCPVMKQNMNTFNDVITWGNENNIGVSVDYVIFASYDHSGCNLKNRLSVDEVKSVFESQLSSDYVETLQESVKENLELKKDNPVCSVCKYYLCVSANGDAFPCVGWQSKVLGNLNTQTVHDVWNNSNEVKELRSIKRSSFPKCVECKDRGYCKVCMMSNSNENIDGDEFKINDYHCQVAAMIHSTVDSYINSKK